MGRRPAAPKAAVEETSERSNVPDQLALAAGRADGQPGQPGQAGRGYQRRGSLMHTRSKDPTPGECKERAVSFKLGESAIEESF